MVFIIFFKFQKKIQIRVKVVVEEKDAVVKVVEVEEEEEDRSDENKEEGDRRTSVYHFLSLRPSVLGLDLAA